MSDPVNADSIAAPTGNKTARVNSRVAQVLDAAATQFAAKGYQATSIRDIVRTVGMLPGSLYCHFANKEELLAAVHAEGVRRICEAVHAAADRRTDPWERLEAACEAHLESLLDHSAYAKVVTSVGPHTVPELAGALIAQRDAYEQLFAGLIDALPLPPRTSRATLRLMLLGALNWVPTWYRPDGPQSPRSLARAFVRLLKTPLQAP
jgi:AcrR family transcriptional regulator